MEKNSVDALYLAGIELIAGLIGYEAAFHLLQKEFQERSDDVQRQMFSLDGALMNDVSIIVKEYPSASVGFVNSDGRTGFRILGASSLEEAEEINRKIDEAIKKRNKLPGMSEVENAFTASIEPVDASEDN